MQKEDINQLLEQKHQVLFDWINSQPEDCYQQGPDEKWTTGQHIQHLVDSIKKLNHALSFPKFILKSKFGVSNRELRDYNAIVNRYQEKLAGNQERAKVFNQDVKSPTEMKFQQLLTTLQIQNKKLQHKTNKFKDEHLDNLILPHPLMGKMPIREVIMWTAYHTEHHTKILQKNH